MTVTAMTVALKTVACCVVCFLLCSQCARAQTLYDLLRRGGRVEHAVFPIYSQSDRQLCTVVNVDRVYLDYQRKGFFHIGLLPVGTLQGVTFEVRQSDTAAGTLAQLQHWLGGGSSRMELRQVKFVFQTNSLEAGRIQIRSHDQWNLLDGVRSFSGGNEAHADRAILQVSGERSGQVILETQPPTTNVFLGLKLN
jgi:hypothetical protein